MFVVSQLQVGVEPHQDGELEAGVRADGDPHPGGESGGQLNVELLLTGETQGGGGLTLQELERNDAHANQVTTVDPLVTLSNNCSYPEEKRSLGGPVSAGATAIIFPRKDDELRPSLGVLLGSVEHVQLLTGGDVNCLGRGLPDELVDDSNVAEGSSGHDSVVASPGAEAVELPGIESPAVQVSGRGRLPGDGPGWRDVIRRHGVAQVEQGVRASDGSLDRQLSRHALKERRPLDVGGGRVPGIQNGLRGGQLVPVGVTGGDLTVHFLKVKLALGHNWGKTKFLNTLFVVVW